MHVQTNKVPLAARLVDGAVDAGRRTGGEIEFVSVVGPRSELHAASLLVERKPADVDCARRDEDSQRHPAAAAVPRHFDVRPELAVYRLVGAAGRPPAEFTHSQAPTDKLCGNYNENNFVRNTLAQSYVHETSRTPGSRQQRRQTK